MQRNPNYSPIDWFDTVLTNLLIEHTVPDALDHAFRLYLDLLTIKFRMEKLTTAVKLAIVHQTHLRIVNHIKIANAGNASPLLMLAQVEHILIGSIIVAMKMDEDLYYVRNWYVPNYWNNLYFYYKVAALNKIERGHLKLCDYAVALTPQKLAPLFEQYADKEALNLLALELSDYQHESFQHKVENEILGIVQTQLYNRVYSENTLYSTSKIPIPANQAKNKTHSVVTYPKDWRRLPNLENAKLQQNRIASGMINANASVLSDKAWKLISKSITADIRKEINHKHYLHFGTANSLYVQISSLKIKLLILIQEMTMHF